MKSRSFEDQLKSEFVEFWDGNYAQCQLLKDIPETFIIDQKPQFQSNILDPEEYRTREQFLDLFCERYTGASNATFDELAECLSSYAEKMSLT